MLRVLVVDKDEAVRSAFQRFFQGRTAEVITAPDLESGIHGGGGVADLILIDELSPDLDKAQALALRERNYGTLTPVVAMTNLKLSRGQWQAMGYSDYLPKPLNAVLVRETLARWLPAEGQRAAS